jgi:O-antigen/teichoic acid export membrane protein
MLKRFAFPGNGQVLAPVLGLTAATDHIERTGQQRTRRAQLTSGGLAATRVVRACISLITVPLTIGYLGNERYGLWLAMNSLVAIFAFADLGLGNGLLNAIAAAHGRDDREDAARQVSSAFFMLLSVACVLAVAFFALRGFIDWRDTFHLKSADAAAEVGPAIDILAACFLVGLPLAVVQRAQLGYQEGFITAAWDMLGNIAMLGALLLAIHLNAGLPALVLVFAGTPILATCCNAVGLFVIRRPWLRPRWAAVSRSIAESLLRVGILFFTLQIVMAAAFFADSFIIARILGASAVSAYAVPWKLFEMMSTVTLLLLTPLWPAFGESLARGDHAWVRSTLLRSIRLVAVLTAIPSLALIFVGNRVVILWTHGAVHASMPLLLGMGVLCVMQSMGNAVVMFLNAANRLRFQIVCAVAMGITALVLKIVLLPRVGIIGIVWSTAGAYGAFSFLPLLIYSNRLISSHAPVDANAEKS